VESKIGRIRRALNYWEIIARNLGKAGGVGVRFLSIAVARHQIGVYLFHVLGRNPLVANIDIVTSNTTGNPGL